MKTSVLVIDDNANIRENIAEILELAGYSTVSAENGKIGVEVAIREQPTLIICDIMMPELDGYGVLHLLRMNPLTERIPLIFVTAKTERADFRKGMELGADDYITKPFDDVELLRAVETRLKKLRIGEQDYPASKGGLTRFLNDVQDASTGNAPSDRFRTESYEKKQRLYQEGKTPRYHRGESWRNCRES